MAATNTTSTNNKQKRTPLHEVSAFVPAYNEAGNIEQVIGRLHEALGSVARRHEIIVVLYEGSTDGTAEIVARLAEQDEDLRVVVQPRDRRGYGVALRLGIEAARYDYVFYTDADNQFDPAEIAKLAAMMEGCDMAVGYREDRQDPIGRKVTAAVYNKLMDLALGTRLRDVDCAFKLFRRQMFAGMRLTSDTGLIDPEIVARARVAGRRIIEQPVTHYPRASGEAHFETGSSLGLPDPKVVVGILKELWGLRKEIREEHKAAADSGHVL